MHTLSAVSGTNNVAQALALVQATILPSTNSNQKGDEVIVTFLTTLFLAKPTPSTT
jgi:hypothetical protein